MSNYGKCRVCGKEADVRCFPGGSYCWGHWEKRSGQMIQTEDDFMTHDLSISNENTEDTAHDRNNA